ncbi:39S ribosomal protein L42, mitochondrial [Tachyglossus aculeatus]|uniref:39S ribosomal protein L42, mitochondrial n=1 Tax=Tachyglossus aculeatus TaxID=9261 RepID=UPI0018F5E2EB|nr:39S ribosomal protein L42, mitochondrial [Tachyglossus aculeatus]
MTSTVRWTSGPRAALARLVAFSRLVSKQNGAVFSACHKSTYTPLPDNYNCKVELALTSDGKTVVCYHPTLDFPYSHTKPLPRPDPSRNEAETHDQILKAQLEVEKKQLGTEINIEQLSKIFYTTKHRWYPVGQYHTRRKKVNPPKER